jgi:prepilin-type N-terminal cleavage/methylation domain-containing protein
VYLFRRGGYTLLEVIVVLVLLTIAAAVVAPSLLGSRPEGLSSLEAVLERARESAVRRGELVRLRIDRSGAWQAVAGTGGQTELLMSGGLAEPEASPIDLIFSPLGTCAPAPESIPVQALVGLDPLTCGMRLR